MTVHQFARAVGADRKWVENAARLLGWRLRYTEAEARRLGLIRLFSQSFGVPLAAADRMAMRALAAPVGARAVRVARSADDSAGIVVDVARYHSSFAAALSAALALEGPRRRGRRPRPRRDPIRAARDHGVDLGLVRASLEMTPAERLARLDEDAAFLRAIRPVRPHRDGRAIGKRV